MLTCRNLDYQPNMSFQLQRFSCLYLSLLLALVAFLSPLAMLILPQTGAFPLKHSQVSRQDYHRLVPSFSNTYRLVDKTTTGWSLPSQLLTG
jgi:hypothetical protein